MVSPPPTTSGTPTLSPRIGVLTDARLLSITLGNVTLDFQAAARSRLYWPGRPAIRLVQALHWLRDMLPSTTGASASTSAPSSDPNHGQAIQEDLRIGLSALPE